MRVVYLEGVLMDNDEFISNGEIMKLTKEHIKKFVKELKKGAEDEEKKA